jgi:NDP-sugar pyrophosphorylase family protein
MILVLTMAGRYSRFTSEGYKFPKYLLPWGDKPILAEILHEMSKGEQFSHVFLVANFRDEAYMPHVHKILSSCKIPNKHLVLIHDTNGQAETAYKGIELIEEHGCANKPILFHNIDTILFKRDFVEVRKKLQTNDGYIDVFKANNHEYSYILLDSVGQVIEIAEKRVISSNATSGMYGFANVQTFKKYYNDNEDLYISSIYKKMITSGGSVETGSIHSESDTIVLGTPTDYINRSILLNEV